MRYTVAVVGLVLLMMGLVGSARHAPIGTQGLDLLQAPVHVRAGEAVGDVERADRGIGTAVAADPEVMAIAQVLDERGNDNGYLDGAELIEAIQRYAAGQPIDGRPIDGRVLIGLIQLYAAGTQLSSPPADDEPLPGALLRPDDLVYQGAFAYPAGEEWSYSSRALAYYPAGDPESTDGYPGSLYAAGHDLDDLVGEITIPEPVIARDFGDLPQANVLRPLTDITEGWIDNCTYNSDCIYRELDGLAYLPNVGKIAWNLRDWYNVGGYDQDSLGWSDRDMTEAQGVWHIGERPSDADEFHCHKTSDYLFKAPQSFAAHHLGGKWLIAGAQNEAGANGGSQGPTLYALAPWEDGSPPTSRQTLDALSLLYYPEMFECVWEGWEGGEGDINEHPDPGDCHFPGYRGTDHWNGGAWVERGDKSAVLIFGQKGLGDNCYGTQAECGGDPCVPSKGYHAYPYEPQILFYDPEELKAVLSGTKDPWEVLPYEVYSPVDEVLDRECALLGAATYDQERGLVYVSEREAGPWGETVVHVWRVE